MFPPPRPTPTAPSRACVRSRKTASRDFFRSGVTHARNFSSKSLNSRQVAEPAATKTVSGVRYYGLRYYSPSNGRWLSRDPMEEAGGANLYGFVRNNPINAMIRMA